MNRAKSASAVLAILGLLAGTLLVAWFGAGRVAGAMLSAGASGFLALCLWQCVLFGVNGFAWTVVIPGRERHRFVVLLGSRMVRDAAANCLPFSQLGGLVAGTRAATLWGMPWPVAAASTIVDVTTEFLAQILFAAIGLVILLGHAPGDRMEVAIGIGLVLALSAGLAFIWLQRGLGSLFGRLVGRIAAAWTAGARDRVDQLQRELSRLHGDARRVLLGMAVHLVGWFGTAIGGWIAFRLLGQPIDFAAAIAIEALLHAVLAIAFLVPGYAGVQEAAYLGLGALFGIPPEIALGVSLLRRARDIAVGIPILLIWQLVEFRRLRVSAPSSAASRY